jgi:hypothetical protein
LEEEGRHGLARFARRCVLALAPPRRHGLINSVGGRVDQSNDFPRRGLLLPSTACLTRATKRHVHDATDNRRLHCRRDDRALRPAERRGGDSIPAMGALRPADTVPFHTQDARGRCGAPGQSRGHARRRPERPCTTRAPRQPLRTSSIWLMKAAGSARLSWCQPDCQRGPKPGGADAAR